MMEEEEETLFDQEGLLGDKNSDKCEQEEKRRKLYKTAALSMAFFSLGCCIAIPGATLLDLGERVGKDTEHMTFIATARSAGYLIGSVFGGILSDFFDHQLLMFYILAFTSMATAVIPWCTVLVALTGMIGVQGIALGVLDTGGNVFCIRIWGKKSPPYMQFLHFAFAIGAFMAPLIAHPFLLNTIVDFSGNSTQDGNISLKAALPYASSEHLVKGRTKRDSPLDVHFIRAEHFHSSLHSPKLRRDAQHTQLENMTDFESSTNTTNHLNNSSLNIAVNDHQMGPTTVRPKKPEVVNALSKQHADSQLIVPKLKDLQKNPITEDEDEDGGDKKNEEEHTPFINPTLTNDLANGSVTVEDGLSNPNISVSSSGKDNEKEKTSLPPQSTITTSTTTTTTSSTTLSTTSTSSTTTSTTSTTKLLTQPTAEAIKTTPSVSVAQSTEGGNGSNLEVNSSISHNTSASHNDSGVDKPETWADLVYGMLDSMRHMSKIQFAYLIIGIFLIANAGVFLSLYCKDKLSGHRMNAYTYEDLTRPPDTPCFVGTLLILLFFFFLFYVGMEQTYGILLTTFAVEFIGTVWTPAQGAVLTAIFWGCVALGRGISICVSRFFKAPCMLVSNLILTLLGGILLSFALKSSWVILWVGTILLGLGMSSLFPTTISWTDSYYPLSGKAAAVFVAGSGVGQMTIPVLTGYLYQNVHHMCLMYVVCALSFLLCVIYTCLQVTASRRGSSSGMSRSYSGFMRLDTSEDMADSLDMDLIQAGGMDRPLGMAAREGNTHAKENGVNGEYEVTEFSKLVELSD